MPALLLVLAMAAVYVGTIETAFSMILTAMALVAGLLIAGVIAPEPRMREPRP